MKANKRVADGEKNARKSIVCVQIMGNSSSIPLNAHRAQLCVQAVARKV